VSLLLKIDLIFIISFISSFWFSAEFVFDVPGCRGQHTHTHTHTLSAPGLQLILFQCDLSSLTHTHTHCYQLCKGTESHEAHISDGTDGCVWAANTLIGDQNGVIMESVFHCSSSNTSLCSCWNWTLSLSGVSISTGSRLYLPSLSLSLSLSHTHTHTHINQMFSSVFGRVTHCARAPSAGTGTLLIPVCVRLFLCVFVRHTLLYLQLLPFLTVFSDVS